MQNVNSIICTQTTELVTVDIIDIRDNKHYYVTREKDGHCWMTQNLDLDLVYQDSTRKMGTSNNGSFRELTKLYTDITTDTWTIPSGSQGYTTQTDSTQWHQRSCSSGSDESYTLTSEMSADATYCDTGYEVRSRDSGNQCINNSNVFATADSVEVCSTAVGAANHNHVGNFYNFLTAIAGGGGKGYLIKDMDYPNSICPSSWGLPIGSHAGDGGDFDRLFQAGILGYTPTIYNSNTDGATYFATLNNNPFWLIRSGMNNFGMYDRDFGTINQIWTSTARAETNGRHQSITKSDLYPGTEYSRTGFGMSVRCRTD